MENIKVSFDNLLVYKKEYTSDKVYELIRVNNLNGLRIFSELRNDRLENINFLKDYTFLEHLDVTSVNDFNFDFLSNLDNLKKLSINVEGTNQIDLSHQTRLQHLSIQWRKGIKGLDRCTSLSSLGIIDINENDLTKLTDLKSLIELRVKTASIESLDGLNGLLNLQTLLVANCNKLISISSINQLPKLQHLGFDTCPNIKDYDHLTSLQNLQSLSVINCGKIESIKFIENYPSLTKLLLLGNTIINDGNLLPAKRLSSVEYKHYSHYNIKLENQLYEQTVKSNLQKIKNLMKK